MKKLAAAALILILLVAQLPVSAFESEYTDPYITLFDLTESVGANAYISFLDSVYKGYADSKGSILNVFFAAASGNLSDITEAGFEIQGKRYPVSAENFDDFISSRMFGIGFKDTNNLLPDLYTAVPYMLAGEKVIKGEERVIDKAGELTADYVKWSERENVYTLQGTEWRFYPAADYTSHQNPPDFSWPYVEQAVFYDLIISKDESFDNIYASAYGLTENYYNFSYTFDEDVYYYKVRFYTAEKASEWSETRRFSIATGSYEFPVDDIDTMLAKIPEEHPRIAVNPDTADTLKSIASYNGHIGEVAEKVEGYLADRTIPSEPQTDAEFFDAANTLTGRTHQSSVVYYFLGNTEAGEYAKEVLLSACDWDIYGTSSYVAHDLAFRDLARSMAFAYSYVRDLLTEEERARVLSVIEERALILENPTEGIMDAISALKYSPYMSHGGSAVEALLEIALCLYGDLPVAERWLRDYLPLYINYFPNWGREDGGWSQGTGYGQYTLTRENLRFTLYINGMVNMYDKPFFKNYYNYMIYNVGRTTGAEFGDESDGITNPTWALAATNIARATYNNYMMWYYNNCGFGRTGAYSRFYMDLFPKPAAKEFSGLPTAHYFKDIGWVSMLSEMNMTDRTATYFKSSSYGSHNHSHADQNTFTISSNGKQLAIDSGYYDGYGSDFYDLYYEQTYSHNGITYNGGTGQTTFAMCANGDIEGYIHSDDFDLAIGNAKNGYNFVYNPATKAYIEKPNFDKMDRYFIYIRPDIWLVIDDIAFAENKTGTLEWWLNAWSFSSMDEEKGEVTIDNGTDALDVKMVYPEGLTLNYFDGFRRPNGNVITPGGSYAEMEQSDRINFQTGEVSSAKFVSALQLRGSSEAVREYTSEAFEGGIKLTFDDGTAVYVNTDGGEIYADGIASDAAAVVVKNGAYMIANGSYLDVDDANLISSDKYISAYIGANELSLFANEDSKISVSGCYSDSYTNEYGDAYTGYIRDGLTWAETAGGVEFNITKGSYKLKY